ncbi:hypothetical protein DE146DRAFT_636828 [Phaeosphaeria sp. MPI-PUGE-AT-0046c]|nr:hypothetical protein DE146DRAFT_636828 [Phaeosphaeria sp. MPI-PUGE-AT-0046c]
MAITFRLDVSYGNLSEFSSGASTTSSDGLAVEATFFGNRNVMKYTANDLPQCSVACAKVKLLNAPRTHATWTDAISNVSLTLGTVHSLQSVYERDTSGAKLSAFDRRYIIHQIWFCNQTICPGFRMLAIIRLGQSEVYVTFIGFFKSTGRGSASQDFILPQWRPVPLLEDVALVLTRRQLRVRPLSSCGDQKVRDGQRLCNDGYATGGGALPRQCSLFQTLLSRLRHQRMQESNPNAPR